MSLTDSWADEYTATSASSRAFAIPRAVPAGSLLVIAVGLTGDATNVTCATLRANAFTSDVHQTHSGATNNITIIRARITTALVAGDNLTLTTAAGVTSNRWALAVGVFNDVTMPPAPHVAAGLSSTSQNLSLGPTSSTTAARSLVVMAVGGASGASPVTGTDQMAVAAQRVTAGASANRVSALLYKYTTTAASNAAASLASGVVSSSVLVAYDATTETAPSPSPPLTLWTGTTEVSVTTTQWTGTAEVAVGSVERV